MRLIVSELLHNYKVGKAADTIEIFDLDAQINNYENTIENMYSTFDLGNEV